MTPGTPDDPADRATWQSGWLAISYGATVHGFAELDITGPRLLVVSVYVMAGDGDVHQTFRIRYDRHQRTVKWQVNMTDEDPAGWDTEEHATIPIERRAEFDDAWRGDTLQPAPLFTALASLFADHFVVLASVDPADLYWDHHWHPGPADSHLWTPAGLDGPSPFAQQAGLGTPTTTAPKPPAPTFDGGEG